MAVIDQQRVAAHVKMKWQGRPCPMCTSGTFIPVNRVHELRELNEGSSTGKLMAVIPVICNNCGNTVLVNCVAAGFLDRSGKPVP